MPDETIPPSGEELDSIDLLPVLVVADVGTLSSPEGTNFGVIRVRWSTAAEYEGGDNDKITTFIIGSAEAYDMLSEDLATNRNNISEDQEIEL